MDDDLPWERLMEISFGVLKIAPENFWAMTPCEFLCALNGFKSWHAIAPRTESMTRMELLELQERFPDITAQA